MARTNGPEGLITVYEEQTRPGRFRFHAMCPLRLTQLIHPDKMNGPISKARAANLITRAAAYHLERAHGPERMRELLSIITKMKRYAPVNLD